MKDDSFDGHKVLIHGSGSSGDVVFETVSQCEGNFSVESELQAAWEPASNGDPDCRDFVLYDDDVEVAREKNIPVSLLMPESEEK